jgi:hypothetical protein
MGKFMPTSHKIDQLVQEILTDIPLKEKTVIANLNADEVPYLQFAFDLCVSKQLGKDGPMVRTVVYRLWQMLKKTHRLRCVK